MVEVKDEKIFKLQFKKKTQNAFWKFLRKYMLCVLNRRMLWKGSLEMIYICDGYKVHKKWKYTFDSSQGEMVWVQLT